MRTRAVQFTAPRRVELVAVDLPRLVGNSWVLVRTLYSGISSGTEMLAYRGELDAGTVLDETLTSLSGSFRYPFSYGYSCVGVVERGTDDVPAGSVVFAFHPHQERFVVRAADVVRLDGVADPRSAALFPLVETALQLTLDADAVHEEAVVVLGLGTVGVLTAVLLRRAGARVVAVEPLEWRRALAESLGITAVEPAHVHDVVAETTAGRGAALVVELTGAPSALPAALPLLAHEGTALVGSWYGTKQVQLPLGAEFHRRRLTIRSSQVSTIPARLQARWDVARRRATARDLLRELPVSELATTTFPLDEAAGAYAAVDRGEPGVLHVALRYD